MRCRWKTVNATYSLVNVVRRNIFMYDRQYYTTTEQCVNSSKIDVRIFVLPECYPPYLIYSIYLGFDRKIHGSSCTYAWNNIIEQERRNTIRSVWRFYRCSRRFSRGNRLKHKETNPGREENGIISEEEKNRFPHESRNRGIIDPSDMRIGK